jgi:hypothetical protein
MREGNSQRIAWLKNLKSGDESDAGAEDVSDKMDLEEYDEYYA